MSATAATDSAPMLNAERIPTLRGATAWRVSSVQAAAGYKRRAKAAGRADLPTVPRRRRAAV